MPTRNVVITDRHQKLIDELVQSGQFQNASEVLREGLRLIEQRETEQRKLQAMRAAIDVGIRDIERGNYAEFDNFDELDAYLRQVVDDALSEEEAAAG